MGTRFPLIVVGTILSSVLFIAIPPIFIFGNPVSPLRWMLPVVIVAWSIAMAMFRSPAVSLLGQYASQTQLPQAMSLLVFVGGVAGAARPVAGDFILNLGPAFAFAIGSFVLLGAVAFLRSVNPDAALSELPPDTAISDRVSIFRGRQAPSKRYRLMFASARPVAKNFCLLTKISLQGKEYPVVIKNKDPANTTRPQ